MKLYKKFVIVFFTCLVTPLLFGQIGSLSGSLMDQNEESVPFATVAVMKLPDSTVVTGSTTEMDGTFNLKSPENGKYVLRFSAIGFESTFTPLFEIASSDFSRDFGLVILKEEITMLNEVMVETWRPQVELEADKMVVRVEGTALAAGSTAFEVISRSPGVTVDQNGNFKLNGKSGISVMVDGRLTYLSPKELQTFLEAMPAENIKNIELIHNPSAKYDAEGTAGILNITLRKNINSGLNGSVYGGYTYKELHLFHGGVNLNYKKGKWNSWLALDVSERGRVRDQEMQRYFTGEAGRSNLIQEGLETKTQLIPSVNLGTEYEINEKHRVGFMAQSTFMDRVTDWNTLSEITDEETADRTTIDARNHLEENYTNSRFNLNYTGDLDTLGTRISADLDYINLDKEVNSNFLNRYFTNSTSETERLLNLTLSDYDIYAARFEVSLPLNSASGLEFGAKASKVISDSELFFYSEEEGEQNLDPGRSNRFKFEEEIYAAFGSYHNRFSEKWSLKAGLRAEQTVAEGTSFTLGQVNTRKYIEFFPNLSIEQTVSKNYSLNYSYSRRINRPAYDRLNPFLFFLDPYTSIVGNPDLKPQITSSFQLGQNLFRKYNLRLSYDVTTDFAAEVPEMDPETNTTIFYTKNMKHFKSYSASLFLPVEINRKWTMENTAVFTRQEYNLELFGKTIENKNNSFYFQSNNRMSLPWDMSLEVNGSYRAPIAYSVYTIGSQWWVDAGLKKSFLEDKLNMTIRTVDIFRSREMDITTEVEGQISNMQQYFGNQAVSISLRYTFSNGKTGRKARDKDLEEMNRMGG